MGARAGVGMDQGYLTSCANNYRLFSVFFVYESNELLCMKYCGKEGEPRYELKNKIIHKSFTSNLKSPLVLSKKHEHEKQ